MKPTTILTVLLLMILAACAPIAHQASQGQVRGQSTEGSNLAYFKGTTGLPDTNITPAVLGSTGRLNIVLSGTNINATNMTISIWGRNATGAQFETINFNSTGSYNSSVLNYSQVDKLQLNQSPNSTGIVTIIDNASGVTIATFNSSQTLAYNNLQLNGTNFAIPAATTNGTWIDLRSDTEFVLYTACNTTGTANVTFNYWTSPDQVIVYTGAVTLPSCNNSQARTTLTDAGVAYMKLGVVNTDNRSNQIYATLVYK